MKPSKYRAIRSEADGLWFDSKKERAHYQELKLRERAGEIKDLVLQPSFPLIVNGTKVGSYRADFQYTETATGEQIIVDVKGVKTPLYRLKKKIVEAVHNIQVREV
jgi:hypothetical protein